MAFSAYVNQKKNIKFRLNEDFDMFEVEKITFYHRLKYIAYIEKLYISIDAKSISLLDLKEF